MSTRVRICLSLALALVGLYGGYSFWRAYQRTHAGPTGSQEHSNDAVGDAEAAQHLTGFQVADFTLTERSGKPFQSADLKGQVWVASFFFTNCSGACIKLNDSIAKLQTDLVDRGVTFVSISVDPENDTPDRLREYAQVYKADPEKWVFLTGDVKTVGRVAEEGFKVPFAQTLHSDRLIAVDRKGRVQGYYSGTNPTQISRLKKKLLQLLAES